MTKLEDLAFDSQEEKCSCLGHPSETPCDLTARMEAYAEGFREAAERAAFIVSCSWQNPAYRGYIIESVLALVAHDIRTMPEGPDPTSPCSEEPCT